MSDFKWRGSDSALRDSPCDNPAGPLSMAGHTALNKAQAWHDIGCVKRLSAHFEDVAASQLDGQVTAEKATKGVGMLFMAQARPGLWRLQRWSWR